MENKSYCEIYYEVARTGKLQQYYTLYRYCSSGITGIWSKNSYKYVKNLSHELDKALKEAKIIAGSKREVYHVKSPKKEYDQFVAFGLKWKNGKDCYYTYPNQKFWSIWAANKESLKQIGFWISKGKDGEFMAFCRLDEAKMLDEGNLEIKTDFPSIENGRQLLTGELVSIKTSFSDLSGEYTRATFQLENGYKINGTLPKGLSSDDIGKSFSFNGTVEDQGNGFGFYKRPAKVVEL